jgi:diguanylate cyclase (GGDEF)-like protein
VSRRRAAAATTIVVLCCLALLLAEGGLSERADQILANLANVVASGAVLVAAVHAAGRSEGRRRTGWLCLAAAGGCWFTGNLLWSWYQLGAEHQPFPSLADVCYLAAVPCVGAALLAFQDLPAAGAGRARVVLNGFLTSSCLMFVAWYLLLGPLWRQGDGHVLNQLVAISYPAVDVALATLALGLLVRSRLPRSTSALVVLGMSLYFIGDAHLAVSTLQQTFSIGKVLDLGWTAGYAALAWAAVLGGSRAPARTTPRARVFEVSTPYLAVLAAAVCAAVASVGQADAVLTALGVLSLLLVALHQGLVLSENVELTSGLERAVAARTAELEASRQELTHLAFHDALTGLVNRPMLRSRLGDALDRLTHRSGCCAVLVLDLDDFKTTNDTLGHSYGDALLVAVAGRLREAARDEHTLARLGGDEFAIVLDGIPGPEAALALADRILAESSRPLEVDGHEIVVSLSIGIVVGEHGDDVDDLLRHADVAMYQSKSAGKGRHTMFAGAMHAEVLDRLRLKADIRRAINDDEFVPYFQAIVDMQTEEVIGVEALARWQHPERGLVSPAVFIPLAEETGVINDIGRLVLEAACTAVQEWRELLERPLTVNVNVSARQLRNPAFVAEVRQVLQSTGIPADAVTLEVTESMLLGDPEVCLATLHALRALGLHLALDDFGTGYNSLSHLKQLPVDHIKIDKSFIDQLREHGESGRVWSRAVIELARHLGLTVTAEGIEEESQASALRSLRCDLGQGFLFARPVPAAELLTQLRTATVPQQRRPRSSAAAGARTD